MSKQCPSCGGDCGRTKQTGCQYKDIPQSQSLLSDEEILKIAREHLDKGLCFDMKARITRSTDVELLAFAAAIESKVRQQDEEMRRDAKAFQDIREHFMIFSYQNGMVSVWGFDGKKVQEFFDSYDITVRGVDSGRDAAFKAIDATVAKQKGEANG